eukprot:gene14878-biopygen9672
MWPFRVNRKTSEVHPARGDRFAEVQVYFLFFFWPGMRTMAWPIPAGAPPPAAATPCLVRRSIRVPGACSVVSPTQPPHATATCMSF